MTEKGAVALIAITVAFGCAVAAAAERPAPKRGDRISGMAGAERLTGGPRPDRIFGRRGADVLRGRGGADRLVGGRGNDRLKGGPGRDEFNMRAGAELPSPGRDRIEARDGRPDEISCGTGRDVAIVDEVEDGVYECERIVAR